MKRHIARFLLLIFLIIPVSVDAAKKTVRKPFMVDSFEDGDLSKDLEWWRFGDLDLSIVDNNKNEDPYLGRRSLRLTGDPSNWYIGGCGAFFGLDMTGFDAIKLIIRGNGEETGLLQIELYDDDNQNWQIEPYQKDPSQTMADDKFIYSKPITWYGWKVLIIPLSHFVDDNKGIGDDIFNPYQLGSSGGLLQLQLVLLAVNRDVQPDIQIDSIKFFKMQKETRRPTFLDDDW